MVKSRRLLGRLLPVIAFFSAKAMALPYASLDAYGFSMGGTSVAHGTGANAGYYNPALLTITGQVDDVSFMAGVRSADKDKVLDALASYQENGLEADYEVALNDFSGGVSTGRQDVFDTATALRNQLVLLANKPIQKEYLYGVVIAIPNQKLDMSLTIDRREVGGAIINTTTNDLDELQTMIDKASDGTLVSTELFYPSELTSHMSGSGVIMNEIGLSMAREVKLAGHDVALGITPKLIMATSFDYAVRVNDAGYDSSLGQKNQTAIDVDLGAIKQFNNGWTAGLAIKNLFGQKYNTQPYVDPILLNLGVSVPPDTLKVKPQARIGASHTIGWTTVALDLDLNESESFGYDSKTQYLAFGAELNLFEMASLRIGYRHNMSDASTSIATVGIGMTVFGAQLDLAAGANVDEINFAAQLGLQF